MSTTNQVNTYMRMNSSLDSYPVFPNWVFTGQLQLPSDTLNRILTNLPATLSNESVVETDKDKSDNDTLNLTKLMGALFYDNVQNHYRLTQENQNIESVNSHFLCIKPTYQMPLKITRNRWYMGAVFLDVDKASSNIYLEMMDSKVYATPIGVQEYTHLIKPEPLKVVFWPAHIPWGLTTNNSNKNSVLFVTTFLINKIQPVRNVRR